MGNIGMGELIIILVIVLVIFGAGKLAQVGDALGRGIANFRKASKDGLVEEGKEADSTPKEATSASDKMPAKEDVKEQ